MKYIKEFLYGLGIMASVFIVIPLIAYTVVKYVLSAFAAKELAFIFIVIVLITLLISTLYMESR